LVGGKIDYKNLEGSVRLAVRQLDNLCDITVSMVSEAENANDKNRAIGLGLMGFTDTIEKLGISYESESAYSLIDEVMEFISYMAIDESANLAKEKGSYPNFAGSMWSKGHVPFDTLDKAEKDRKVKISIKRGSKLDWDKLRKK